MTCSPASSLPASVWPLVAGPGAAPPPRIHVLSDLHLDTGPYALPEDLDFDILVAAGDIGPLELSVPWLAAVGKPVVYVLGNHEHYGRAFTETLTLAKSLASGTQVHVLERESIVIQGVEFLGATLWSSYGNWHPELVREASFRMNDYREISAGAWRDTPSNEAWLQRHCRKIGMDRPSPVPTEDAPLRFHPAMAYFEHIQTVKWLQRKLKRKSKRPVFVVSHQAPTYAALRAAGIREELLDPQNWDRRYRDKDLVRVAAYASPMEGFLREYASRIAVWAHGHMHHGHDSLVAGVRVLCNPRGHHCKPLTEKSAEAYRFWGLPVTKKDIERSQALSAEDPYRGDAYGFEPTLVVDLEDGPTRPLELALVKPLEHMRALRESAASFIPFVFEGAQRQQEAVARCFADDCKQFGDVLEPIEQDICKGLDQFYSTSVIRQMSAPPSHPAAPWAAFEPVTTADYERVVALMDQWIDWAETLPQVTRSTLAAWAAQAYRALAVLAERGIAGTISRPDLQSLRTVSRHRILVLVDLPEGTCRELEDELDRLISPRVPRRWSVSVWNKEDRYGDENRGLSLAALAPWDQGLSLEIAESTRPPRAKVETKGF